MLLAAVQETGAALMLVTHDEHIAAAVGTRTLDFSLHAKPSMAAGLAAPSTAAGRQVLHNAAP